MNFFSQNIPLAHDSRIQEMREMGLREDGLQPIHGLQVSQTSEASGDKQLHHQLHLQGSEMVRAMQEIHGIREIRENPFSESVSRDEIHGIQLPTVGGLEDMETDSFNHPRVFNGPTEARNVF